jgi:endonuclease/exonuclease/phosphatase (EEP) superfamily protein YafD
VTFIKWLFQLLSSFAVVGLVGAVAAGLLAKTFWWAELFTHFTIQIWAISGVVLILLFIQSAWKSFGIVFLIMLWHCYLVLPIFIPDEHPALQKDITADYPKATRILQFNLHYSDLDATERMKWVLQEAPKMDVIVLLEVAEQHQALIVSLQRQFPYSFIKPLRGYRGVAIFSRLNNSEFVLRDVKNIDAHFVIMNASDKLGVSTMSMFVIHPPPPVSQETATIRNNYFRQVEEEIKASKTNQKILVGDFNMTRWSPYFKEFMASTNMIDSFEGFGFKTTWPNWMPPPMRLTIDNLLVYKNPAASRNMVTLNKEVGPDNGSDHYPVITTLY